MNIEIQARQFMLSEALSDHVQRRIGFALSKRYQHIKRIIVRLSDINGPRGGNDKRCHIQISMPHQADVVVEDVQSDLYMAVDRAADRAGRTVTKRLSKLRQFRKSARRERSHHQESETTEASLPTGDES